MARVLRNGAGRALAVMAIMAAVGTVGAGCHLLDINNPDIVPPVSLDDPLALATIRAGAIGDFGVAYTGSGAQGSRSAGWVLIQSSSVRNSSGMHWNPPISGSVSTSDKTP